jgi:hypothetical protein
MMALRQLAPVLPSGRLGAALCCGSLLLLVSGSGCVPPDLVPCEHADGLIYLQEEGEQCPQICSDGAGGTFDWPSDGACPACWSDEDGDGFGVQPVAGSTSGDCPTDDLAAVGGDCDDTDDNRFPGNSEVCDGSDNDCDEHTEFYSGEAQVGESGTGVPVYDCDPSSSYLVFLRGGSTLAGQPISAGQPAITVAPGSSLEGTIRLRARNRHDGGALVPVVWVNSWRTGAAGQPSPFTPLRDWTQDRDDWAAPNPGGDADPTDPPPGISDNEFDVDLQAPDEPGTYFMIVAVSGQTTHAHVAAMSTYDYCSSIGQTCVPVWEDEFVGLGGDGKLNLVNLTEQMMAGCFSYGATMVPWVEKGLDPSGELCDDVDGDPGCQPTYKFDIMGCVYVKVDVVEE